MTVTLTVVFELGRVVLVVFAVGRMIVIPLAVEFELFVVIGLAVESRLVVVFAITVTLRLVVEFTVAFPVGRLTVNLVVELPKSVEWILKVDRVMVGVSSDAAAFELSGVAVVEPFSDVGESNIGATVVVELSDEPVVIELAVELAFEVVV